MLLRTLPDFAATPVELRSGFNSRWGRENCIIWGRARRARFGPCAHGLSIRAAWGGEERCQFDGRTVAVDDDSFLILNNGRVCTTQIESSHSVESFAIYFGPALVERAYGAMTLSIEKALARGDTIVERSAEFVESLQPHDKLVSPVLRFIRLHVLRGLDDEAWYDEQLQFLLERMEATPVSILVATALRARLRASSCGRLGCCRFAGYPRNCAMRFAALGRAYMLRQPSLVMHEQADASDARAGVEPVASFDDRLAGSAAGE